MSYPQILDSKRDRFPNSPPRLLLFGPPGTGKTRAALDCFLLPALESGIELGSILSCSFTRAAAIELRERLGRALDREPDSLRKTCSTIHSEAFRLGKTGGPGFLLLTRDEQEEPEDRDADWILANPPEAAQKAESKLTLFQRVTQGIPSDLLSCWDYVRALCQPKRLAHVASSKCPGMEAGDFEHLVGLYEKRKRECGVIDFTDMLQRALGADVPERELLVLDEAQDCSELQWRLIDEWAAHSRFVVVIGDPNQCIHEWTGVRYERFRETIQEGFEVRRLAKSYRVPRVPFGVAMRPLKAIEDRIEVPYEPADVEGSFEFGQRNSGLANRLEKATRMGDSVFVLAPRVADCQSWAAWLVEAGIPFLTERGGPCPWASQSRLSIARCVLALLDPLDEPNPKDLKALAKRLPASGSTSLWAKRSKAAALREAEDNWTSEDWARAGLELRALSKAKDSIEAGEMVGFDGVLDQALLLAFGRWGPVALQVRPKTVVTTYHGSKGREADLVVIDMSVPPMVDKAKREGRADGWRRALYVALTRSRRDVVAVGRGMLDELC